MRIDKDALSQVSAALSAGAAEETSEAKKLEQIVAQQQLQKEQESEGGLVKMAFKSTAQRSQKLAKPKKTDKTEKPAALRPIKEIAEELNKKNPQLKKEDLEQFTKDIKGKKTKEEILQLIQAKSIYSHPENTEQILRFLIETAEDVDQQELLKGVHAEFIEANKSQIEVATRVLDYTHGILKEDTGGKFRGLYQSVAKSERDAVDIFQDLSKQYTYQEIENIIHDIFKKVGSDLKPEERKIVLETPEMTLLLGQTRTLQAIHQMYETFRLKQPFIDKQYDALPEHTHIAKAA